MTTTTTKTPKPPRKPEQRVVYGVLGLLVAVLLIGTGAFLWLGGSQPAGLAVGGPFVLEDGAGKTVSDRDYRGKYMLVYFGYTFCPDVCPTELQTVAAALAETHRITFVELATSLPEIAQLRDDLRDHGAIFDASGSVAADELRMGQFVEQ